MALEVSGINGLSSTAAKRIASRRLYSTSLSLSWSPSSRPKIHGSVSSIYLFARRSNEKISSIASAICMSFICFSTRPGVLSASSESSLSISAALPWETMPSKYLRLMVIVRLTRFPRMLASSELIRSIISSYDITPSFANGISCRTK